MCPEREADPFDPELGGGGGVGDCSAGGQGAPSEEDAETEDPAPEELLDPDDLEDLAAASEDGDPEEGAAEGEALEGDSIEGDDEGTAAAAPAKKKALEEEPPGPDIPAPPKSTLREALEWAFQDEIGVPPELLDRFAEHAYMMLEANRHVNLTGILDPREVAAKHYLDSWRVLERLSFVGRTVVDLGSGAGFPGLPIAMAERHTSVTLIDSTKKKADFLADCIEKLGIKNARSHWGRAEEYLATNRCDVVVVRAVSSVRENVRTLRKVRQSLKDLVMLKGASWSREVRAGEREAERLGFTLDTVAEHELPEDMGKRGILVYRAPGGHGQ